MHIQLLLISLAMTTSFTITACSSDSDDPQPTDIQFNPDGEQTVDDGQGGGDTSAIAGLWDGSVSEGDATDVIYWDLDVNGVLTRYDYQQDGALAASGDNCYVVGDPISVTPEGDDSYSFFNVATTAVVNDETLTITFLDADVNDLDNDGDTDEMPTLIWTLLSTPLLEDLNACIEETDQTDITEMTDDTDASGQSDGSDNTNGDNDLSTVGGETGITDNDDADIPFDNTDAQRPLITRAQCLSEGGSIIGDIGNGAIHQPEYRCESGEPPIARITYLEGEPIAAEGEVCCL